MRTPIAPTAEQSTAELQAQLEAARNANQAAR